MAVTVKGAMQVTEVGWNANGECIEKLSVGGGGVAGEGLTVGMCRNMIFLVLATEM